MPCEKRCLNRSPNPGPLTGSFLEKKFFDVNLKKPYLEVNTQFYCASTGVNYEVKVPTKFLIVCEGENKETIKRLCKKNEYGGYVCRQGQSSMEPPLPPDVVFWVFPDAVFQLTNWKKCNLLRYASREPENSWKGIQDLVARVGFENASRLLYADESQKA